MIERRPERAVIAGLCAGIAERYGISPGIVRLCWIAGTVLTSGAGLLLYGILAVLTPSEAGRAEAEAPPGVTVDGHPPWTPGRAVQLLIALLWLFLVLLAVQVYLAGAFLLGGIDGRTAHQVLGYVLTHFYPLVVALIALAAGAPRPFWLAGAAALVLLIAQPMLVVASVADGYGWMRALHAPNALLLALLACYLLHVVRAASRSASRGYANA